METKFKLEGKEVVVKENMLDRVVRYCNPSAANARFSARIRAAFTSGYVGASRTKNSLRGWNTSSGDADAETLLSLPDLRDRSSWLLRNNPLALGAVETLLTYVIGPGLQLKSQINHEFLGMSEDEADIWEENTQREFLLWAESTECDAARKLNFYEKQILARRSEAEKGDYFELMPEIKRKGSPYKLKLQSIEAERVSNPNNKADTDKLSGGIEVDKYGAAEIVHVASVHPGSNTNFQGGKWEPIEVFGKKTGRRNIIHLSKVLRPGQRRGVPLLAPVIDIIKQMGRYIDSELMASVVMSKFTVFLEQEFGGETGDEAGLVDTGKELKTDGTMSLGDGTILELNPGQTAKAVNPGRPNTAFDGFISAMMKLFGSAIQIPFEVILGHFTSSFSASIAAMNKAWKFFSADRNRFADSYCRPIYENWMWEAVSDGRIHAPGFMSDAATRKAYLGSDWIGPIKGQMKEGEGVRAMRGRLAAHVTTIDQETTELTGRSFKNNARQIAKEIKILKKMGLFEENENTPTDKESAEIDKLEALD